MLNFFRQFHAVCFLSAILINSAFANEMDPSRIYLIIHADDAGMSHSVNMATIEGMEKGIVSSCSIMVPCPWFKEFAEYAHKHPDKDYGLHLTLNSEWKNYKWGPVAPREKVPSLLDPEGYLWDDVPLVLMNAKASEVEIELRAQIDRALAFKIPVSHLDTHMGSLVCRPDILEVYVRMGLEYKLPVMLVKQPDAVSSRAFPWLPAKAAELRPLVEESGFPVLDSLLRFNNGDTLEQRRANYLNDLRELKPGLHQLIIHCGIANEELQGITGTWKKRDADLRVFTDPDVIAEIRKLGIEVITWKQAHEMVRTKKTAAAVD